MTPNNPEQSNCCKAPITATHGCDDDFLHGGKKCTCEIVTSWYECEKCKQPCDPLGREMGEVSKIGTDSPVFTKAFQDSLKSKPTQKPGWEEEFDEKIFTKDTDLLNGQAVGRSKQLLYSFIRKVEKEAYERGRQDTLKEFNR